MTPEQYIAALRHIQTIVNEALREVPSNRDSGNAKQPAASRSQVSTTQVSFDMNILAFMNKYAKDLSGPKKFALLVAHLARGDIAAQIPYQDIRGQWNKMTTVLGGDFNPAHGNRAKAAG